MFWFWCCGYYGLGGHRSLMAQHSNQVSSLMLHQLVITGLCLEAVSLDQFRKLPVSRLPFGLLSIQMMLPAINRQT